MIDHLIKNRKCTIKFNLDLFVIERKWPFEFHLNILVTIFIASWKSPL